MNETKPEILVVGGTADSKYRRIVSSLSAMGVVMATPTGRALLVKRPQYHGQTEEAAVLAKLKAEHKRKVRAEKRVRNARRAGK